MAAGRFFALYAFLPALLAAQPYGYLQGHIFDISEGGIGAAAVSVVSQDTGFRRTAQSEPDGGYAVGALQPGTYKITVRRDGFRTVVRFGVAVVSGAATRADFVLPVGPIEETITVEGTAPLIEQDSAAAGARVDRAAIDRLPLNGRGVLSLLELAPGANVVPATRGDAGQFTANGQRPNTNYFTVDGVSANTGVSAGGLPAQSTGGALPALSAFGSMDSLLSLEAVAEFRVATSTAVAEFGRLPGASLTLSSRSGSNQFHGTTLYRLRHETLAANDWFANREGLPRLRQRVNDFTQTLGGPLRRDRTFFFLSFQHISLLQPYVWRQPVPSAESRERASEWAIPLLRLFPVAASSASSPTVPWTGRRARPAGLNTGGLRIDQTLGSRVTLFGRYNDSPSTNRFGNLTTNQLDLRSYSYTMALSVRATAHFLLDLRVNHSRARAHSSWRSESDCLLEPVIEEFLRADAPCDYLLRLSISGAGPVVSGREGDRWQRQTQILQTGSWRRGGHALMFGADYRGIRADRRDASGTLSLIADGVTALADRRSMWIGRSAPQAAAARVGELSLWAMDTWQMGDRFTLAAGLRWEFSPAPVPDSPIYFLNPVTQRASLDRQELWTTRYRNFAPRIGGVLRLTRDGRTVLRAGGGLYYNSSLSIATDGLNGGPLSTTSFTSELFSPFSAELSYGFVPGLQLPSVAQWNVALERAWSGRDVLSLGYLGSDGRNLLRREVGGPGSTATSFLALTTNHGFSDYHALALQYRRSLAKGVQAMAAYTWSHSIDNGSSDAFLVWAAPGPGDRGSSDFDLRHTFTAAATYEPAFLRGWAIDGMARARTGFPMTPLQREEYIGIGLSNAFRPDLAVGQPLWIADVNSPGGRRLNPLAFLTTKSGTQGLLGRNVLEGFGTWQLDLALRREFRLSDRSRLQFRVEAFNAFNHPGFADPVKYRNNPLFGQPASMLNLMLGSGSPGSGLAPLLQSGGPRSVQGTLRLQF